MIENLKIECPTCGRVMIGDSNLKALCKNEDCQDFNNGYTVTVTIENPGDPGYDD